MGSKRPVIFLDDGGVMNDNAGRGARWRQLIGEYFVPRLGGTHEAWSQANFTFTEQLFEPSNWQRRLESAPDYATFDRTYQLDWLNGMCQLVGVEAPAEEAGYLLARQASAYITRRASAPFPGVVETIQLLHEQGYTLHTASGEPSFDLEGYLTSMGVRACFERLYGPDLIDIFKNGPDYYERIFAEVGIAPAEALIVDDSPNVVQWADLVGACTVLVGNTAQTLPASTHRIKSLAELPALLPHIS